MGLRKFFHIFLVILFTSPLHAGAEWNKTQEGYFWIRSNVGETNIKAAKFSLTKFKLKIVFVPDTLNGSKYSGRYTLDAIANYMQPFAAINAGLSTHREFPYPTSALIVNHKTISKINKEAPKKFSWIVCGNGNEVHLNRLNEIEVKDCDYALQIGPGLIYKGKPTENSKEDNTAISNRSAICIDSDKQLVLIQATKSSFNDLKNILAKSPYYCVDAIALNGGYQSGLYLSAKESGDPAGTTSAIIPSAIVIVKQE